jgi:hypothetical protein
MAASILNESSITGGKWKTWKKRYFVLKESYLYYFSDPKVTFRPVSLLMLLQTGSSAKGSYSFGQCSDKQV